MTNKPKNCVVWGERGDVDSFLQASDLFFFGSRGDRNNKELNPIAIKEALEYKMPMMMYNLDVYCGKYNTEESITFLTGDIETDVKNMVIALKPEKMLNIEDDELIIISTYPDTSTRIKLTKECVESFRKTKRKILLVSHYPVSEEIQRMVDYYVYDEKNVMITNSYYNHFYNYKHNYDVNINLNGLEKPNQSLAAMNNFHNGVKFAKSIGASKIMIVTYDVILQDQDLPLIENYFNKLDEWKCCIAFMDTDLGKGVETTSMVFRTDYFLDIFPDIRNEFAFNKQCELIGAQNFLEDYMYKTIKDEVGLWVVINQRTILPNSGVGVSSCSEYMSILPIDGEDNKLMFYFFTYNIDDKIVHVRISSNDIVYDEVVNKINESREIQKVIEFKGYPITVTVDKIDNGVIYKSTNYEINSNNFKSFKKNGYFKYKNQVKNQVTDYKIKLIHLQTTLDDEREQKSRESLSKVTEHGIEYVLHQNEPFRSLPPSHNCIRPQCVSMELFDEETANRLGTALTPSHYGCYDSFKTGILSEFDNDLDFLIVCEGDCIIEVPMNEFVDKVNESCRIINEEGVEYFSFGDTKTLDFGWHQSNVVREIPNQDLMFITDKIIGLQCIMFPKNTKEFLFNKLRTHKWDAADIYFNTIFGHNGKTMGILKDRITTQADGVSLIDKEFKTFIK
jgi:hypothetical protein